MTWLRVIRKVHQIEVMMGRNVNSVEEFTNQQNVLHMGRNVANAKKIIGQTAVTPKRFTKHHFTIR